MSKRRQLARELTIDLEQLGRDLLMDRYLPNEELLEVYRWIAVTADESGPRWRTRDSWAHRRYPGIRDEFALRQWSTYPTNEDGFDLCFQRSSREFAPKIRETVIRAAFGDRPQLLRWRKDHGRAVSIPCRVLRRKDGRLFDPLREVYSAHPSRFVPQVIGTPRLSVSLNSIHKKCKTLHAFVLMPEAEGWRFAVSFGSSPSRRYGGACSEWRVFAGKWMQADHSDIPVQQSNESANEFFERCCTYARSILDAVPLPVSIDERLARLATEQASKVEGRVDEYALFEIGGRQVAGRSREHALAKARRRTGAHVGPRRIPQGDRR